MTSHRLSRVALVDRFRLVTQVLDVALSSICRPVPLPVQSLHSTAQVLSAITSRRVDVVVLGHALGGTVDNEQLVAGLTERGLRVVAVADDEDDRLRLARAGAAATVLRSEGVAEVRDAIAKVLTGRRVDDAGAVIGPVPLEPHREALRRLDTLSRREVDVLGLLVLGRSAAEIARDHVVSELTVRSQLKSILRKLDVPSQLAAVALVCEARWEPPLPDAA